MIGQTIMIIIFGGSGGAFLGLLMAKKYVKMENKRLERRAVKMSLGEIENQFMINGKRMDVNKFILRDDKGKEITQNLVKAK